MLTFVRESLQLLHYAYFKPSALRARLNGATPRGEGDTNFGQLSLDIFDTPGARRLVLQCALWWLLGLLPFWSLAWNRIPWPGMFFVGGSLLLAGWGLAIFDLPLGLAFPLLGGLVWGLQPALWEMALAALAPWLDNRYVVGVLVADLILGAVLLGGGGAAWAMSRGHKRVAAWVAGLAFVAFVVAFVVAGVVAFVVAGVVAGVVAFGVAVVVAGVVGGVVAGDATLPLIPALALTMTLGLVASPRRSIWPGLVLAALWGVAFIESQGWQTADLVLLSFLVGYLRLPLYPAELLTSVAAAALARFGKREANVLVRLLPPFSDEIARYRLFGLDKVLVAALKQNAGQGREAVETVAASFRQGWAARAALLEWTAHAIVRYRAVSQIPNAPQQFDWLPDEPDRSLRDTAEVRRRVEEIARQVESALSATSDYNRLRRLSQAQAGVGEMRKSFAALGRRTTHLFGPVAERWQTLIGAEIGRLSAESEVQADIPNPYIISPLQADEAYIFAPRPDLVRAVENALTTEHGKPTLALYGPRRMGKTTFLLHLPRLLPDEIVPVFVDLQYAVQVSGPAGLYYNWAAAAHEAARRHRRLDVPKPDLAAFGVEPAIAWREWLDTAEANLKGRKLFLAFDEFERLVDKAEREPALEGAFDILRHLSQHRPRVYLLFAGAYRMEELAPAGRWHDYFINVRGLDVSYLDEKEARRLLTNPIPDFPLDYAEGAVDEIVRLTHCQPYLVQLMGSVLVDWLNSPRRREQGDWRTASLEDVAHAAEEIVRVGRPYFANLWDGADETGRQVLRKIVSQPDAVPQAALAQETALLEDELRALLRRLEQYRLIEPVGGRWRVQVELTHRAFVGFL